MLCTRDGQSVAYFVLLRIKNICDAIINNIFECHRVRL